MSVVPVEKMLMDVARAVLDNCLEMASHGRSLEEIDLNEVIAGVTGAEIKGVVVGSDLVDSLVGMVSSIDVNKGVIEMAEVDAAGMPTPYGKSKALLHKAGIEWDGKDPVHCEQLLTALNAKSLAQAYEIASAKAEVQVVDASVDQSFEGSVMGVTDQRLHVVQSAGRNAVIHEAAKLGAVPEQGAMVNVEYKGGQAKVAEVGKDRGRGVER